MNARAYSPARCVTAAMLVIGSLGACTTWTSVAVAPERYVATKQPEHIRVRHRAGYDFELFNPIIRQDSLVGSVSREPAVSNTRPLEHAVPLSDIVGIEVQRAHTGYNLLLVGAVVALITVIDYH